MNNMRGKIVLRQKPQLRNFYVFALVIPTIFSMWYISGMFFPPEAKEKFGFFLWSPGALTRTEDGPMICPYAAICAVGVAQIVLVGISRLSAFASYSAMALTFMSKMHSLVHYLSTTYMSSIIPFTSLHDVHNFSGRVFGWSAFIHAIAHYIRYIVRSNVDNQLGTMVHISGIVALIGIGVTTISMSEITKNYITFERRLNSHWAFIIVVIALAFHNERTRVIMLVFL